MKFKKALSLLPAMLLVLSLGACNDASEEGGTSAEVRDDAAYTLSITITYDDETQEVPEYASIYYSGETNNWGFIELAHNGTAYELYFDEIPEAGEYQFSLVVEAKGTAEADVTWDHKVNQGSGNETFTVLGTEEEGYVNSVTVATAQALTDLFPDPALEPATNATFSFIIDSSATSGKDVYFIGGFNGDNWNTWLKCVYNETSTGWEYTFETLQLGTVGYKVVTTATGVSPTWSTENTQGTVTELTPDGLSVTIDQSFSNNTYTVNLTNA